MSKINESEKEEKKRQKINAQTRIKRNALKSCCTTTSASSFFFFRFLFTRGTARDNSMSVTGRTKIKEISSPSPSVEDFTEDGPP